MTLFQQGCETLGVEGGDAVSATDKFLSDAQQVWYKDAPMDKVGKFTTENVPAGLQFKMDQAGAPGATRYLQKGGVLTGRSNVYFNMNLAFRVPNNYILQWIMNLFMCLNTQLWQDNLQVY